jgi:hypothetical protein
MSFMRKIGAFAGSSLKKVGSFGNTVSKIANSGVTRKIASMVGTVGKDLLPLAGNVLPANVSNIAQRGLTSLQNGTALNKVSAIGNDITKVSKIL